LPLAEEQLYVYHCASFTNWLITLLKLTALYFGRLAVVNPVGVSWSPVAADHHARQTARPVEEVCI